MAKSEALMGPLIFWCYSRTAECTCTSTFTAMQSVQRTYYLFIQISMQNTCRKSLFIKHIIGNLNLMTQDHLIKLKNFSFRHKQSIFFYTEIKVSLLDYTVRDWMLELVFCLFCHFVRGCNILRGGRLVRNVGGQKKEKKRHENKTKIITSIFKILFRGGWRGYLKLLL